MAHKDLPKFDHVDLLHPSNYVKAGELQGRDIHVTIKDVEPRHKLKTTRGEEAKPVLWFQESEKGMVLNKTNARSIAKVHGPKPSGWIGKRITLYPTDVSAFGEIVTAIRVRETIPPTKRKK